MTVSMASVQSYLLRESFQYRHNNPYHMKLQDYHSFVLRDRETEQFAGHWGREVFGNNHPVVVEVGSGYGHFMLQYCRKNPAVNFVGLDYRFKRSFQLAKKIHRHGLSNVRYLRARGERLHFIFGPEEVSQVFFFFPDPWPKQKQQKKRLLQPAFLNSVHRVLQPQGRFFIKTDHSEYAEAMASHFQRDSRWEVELATDHLHRDYPEHFLSAHLTKFEKIFLAQGVPIKAFVLRKRGIEGHG